MKDTFIQNKIKEVDDKFGCYIKPEHEDYFLLDRIKKFIEKALSEQKREIEGKHCCCVLGNAEEVKGQTVLEYCKLHAGLVRQARDGALVGFMEFVGKQLDEYINDSSKTPVQRRATGKIKKGLELLLKPNNI